MTHQVFIRERRSGKLVHVQHAMFDYLRRCQRCIRAHREVYPRIGHQVRLKLVHINVECTLKAQRSCKRRDTLRIHERLILKNDGNVKFRFERVCSTHQLGLEFRKYAWNASYGETIARNVHTQHCGTPPPPTQCMAALYTKSNREVRLSATRRSENTYRVIRTKNNVWTTFSA